MNMMDTNWTEGGDITSGRKGAGGSGASSTAALILGSEKTARTQLQKLIQESMEWNLLGQKVNDLNQLDRANMGVSGTNYSCY